jgi:hypothetical protein
VLIWSIKKQLFRGPSNKHSYQSESQLDQQFQRRIDTIIFDTFGPLVFLFFAILTKKNILFRGQSNEHSYQVWFHLAQWFQRRKLKYKSLWTTTQCGNGNTSHDPVGLWFFLCTAKQQQKNFSRTVKWTYISNGYFKKILIFIRAIWKARQSDSFGKGPSEDSTSQVCLNLAQWF